MGGYCIDSYSGILNRYTHRIKHGVNMQVLHLTLKRHWFNMILSGEKKDEYREIKEYWVKRLIDVLDPCGMEGAVFEEMVNDLKQPFRRHTDVPELLTYFGVHFKDFDVISFKNRYTKDAPKFTIECLGLDIKTGREKWGAEKGKFYFSLRLGHILSVST